MIPYSIGGIPHQAYGAVSPPSSFTFAAGADIGNPTQAAAVSLSYLESTNPDFFLALGDLSYDPSVTGGAWCDEFKEQFKNVEIIAGAHDTGEFSPNSTQASSTTRSYQKFVENCPFTLSQNSVSSPVCGNVTGQCYGDKHHGYGREYYFDYPSTSPLARFIMISPGVFNITGGCVSPCTIPAPGILCNGQDREVYDCWPYAKYDGHYNWTSTAIKQARQAGEWVIVGMHKPCISAAKENCDIGPDIFNLLVGNGDPAQGVDLILEGNDHAYERSKQFTLKNTCNKVPYNTTSSFVDYNQDCVLNGDGSNGFYTPHAGTILVVQGTMGGGWDDVDGYSKNQNNALEAPYFARLMGNYTVSSGGIVSHGPWVGTGHGFVKYTVSSSEIDVETVFTGTFQDKFRIAHPPVPAFSWAPHSLSIGETVTFNGSAVGDGPLSYGWDFGDGGTGEGPVVMHAFGESGRYTVTLTVTNSSAGVGTVENTVAIGSWNPVVNCSPVRSTIEDVIGPKGIPRNSTNPNSIGADYSGGGFQLIPNMPYGSNPTSWPFFKRAVNLPPSCSYGGIPALVELHDVGVRTVSIAGCSQYYDVSNGGVLYPNGSQSCVTAFNLENWNYTTCPTCYMHRIYAYIDRDWNASGDAPYPAPTKGERIDVQGFIYWEYSSVTTSWHSFSGWELLVTSWRVSQQNQTQPPIFTSRPRPVFPVSLVYVGLASLSSVGVFVTGNLYNKRRRGSRN